MQKIGTSLSVGLTLPLLGAGAAAIKFASDYEESLNKVDVAFGSSQDSVKQFAQTSLQQFGIAEGSALDMAALFGDMATSMGQPQEEAAKMSTALVGLAGDLASFKNIGIEQATTALNAVFTGETESLKRLGVVMTQTNLQQFALSRGIKKNIQDFTEAEKVQLRYAFVMDRTSNSQGDFARTGGGAANQMRIFQESLKQLSQQFGAVILPAFTSIITKVNNLVSGFSKLSPATKKLIVIFAGIAAAIGPLLVLSGTILPALATGFALLTGPIGLIVAGLTAVGVVIYKNWAPIKRVLIDIANYFIDLYNESTLFRVGVQAVIKVFKDLFEVGKFIFETLKNLIGGFIENFVNGFKTIGKIIKAVFTGNFSALPGIIKEAVNSGKSTFSGFTDELANDWKNLTDGIKDNTQDAIEAITTKQKIKFLESDVDAKGVEKAVSGAVGKGLSTGGTIDSPTVDTGKLTGFELFDFEKANEGFAGLDELLNNTKQKFADAFDTSQAEVFADTLSNSFTNAFDTTAIDAYTQNFADNAARLAEIGATIPEAFVVALGETNAEILTQAGENFTAYVDNAVAQSERLIEISNLIGSEVGNAFEDLSGRVVESLGLANQGFEGFIKGLVQTVTKLISIMLAQSISQAIAGATASGTATGPAAIFTTPAFIAQAVSGVLAAFAAIPKFEHGGVVGGNSFYGDKILARLNSQELILSTDQQKRLYGLIQPVDAGAAQVFIPETRIQGEDIIIAYKRAENKNNRRG